MKSSLKVRLKACAYLQSVFTSCGVKFVLKLLGIIHFSFSSTPGYSGCWISRHFGFKNGQLSCFTKIYIWILYQLNIERLSKTNCENYWGVVFFFCLDITVLFMSNVCWAVNYRFYSNLTFVLLQLYVHLFVQVLVKSLYTLN